MTHYRPAKIPMDGYVKGKTVKSIADKIIREIIHWESCQEHNLHRCDALYIVVPCEYTKNMILLSSRVKKLVENSRIKRSPESYKVPGILYEKNSVLNGRLLLKITDNCFVAIFSLRHWRLPDARFTCYSFPVCAEERVMPYFHDLGQPFVASLSKRLAAEVYFTVVSEGDIFDSPSFLYEKCFDYDEYTYSFLPDVIRDGDKFVFEKGRGMLLRVQYTSAADVYFEVPLYSEATRRIFDSEIWIRSKVLHKVSPMRNDDPNRNAHIRFGTWNEVYSIARDEVVRKEGF